MTDRSPLRVLVVEDSEDDYDLLLSALRRGGYAVESARVSNGPDMLTMLDAQSWDVVLVDWVLPCFSAPHALDLLRAHRPGMPCVVVSGAMASHLPDLAAELGARAFFSKQDLPAVAEFLHLMLGEP